MQKINLKNTTKDKLYATLCDAETKYEELENSYRQLEADSMKRIDQLNNDLAAEVKEKNGYRKLYENRCRQADEMNRWLRNLEEERKWRIEHPWKHLWWCLRGKNHEA